MTKQEKYLSNIFFNWVDCRLCVQHRVSFSFFSHFHGYFDLLFAALSGYSMVCISIERWFSVWKPFDKAKYVTFKTTIITVVSYISISSLAFSWFPFALSYNPMGVESEEICKLSRPILYTIFGTFSVIFTYIGKKERKQTDILYFFYCSSIYFPWNIKYSYCLSFTCSTAYIYSTIDDFIE